MYIRFEAEVHDTSVNFRNFHTDPSDGRREQVRGSDPPGRPTGSADVVGGGEALCYVQAVLEEAEAALSFSGFDRWRGVESHSQRFL